MIVVVIIGVVASIAIPAFTRIRMNSRNTRFIEDLQVFSRAFETYAAKNGTWPASAALGVVPTGMSGELRDTKWKETNTVGGRWRWIYVRSGRSGFALVLTSGVTASDAQMLEVDKKIDDGNLSTGMFVRSSAGQFIYFLQRP